MDLQCSRNGQRILADSSHKRKYKGHLDDLKHIQLYLQLKKKV